jgi:hypothetical protein
MRSRIPFWALFLLALLGGVLGCGGGDVGTARVSGRVMYKGKPVPKATVSFTPMEGASRAASGLTDTAGDYTLGSFSVNDGALPGKYRVSIIARGPDRPPKPGEMGSGMPGEMMPGEPVIPAKYFAPDTSGLTFEVKRGGNRADFELND